MFILDFPTSPRCSGTLLAIEADARSEPLARATPQATMRHGAAPAIVGSERSRRPPSIGRSLQNTPH
jgi:hypothetical protein